MLFVAHHFHCFRLITVRSPPYKSPRKNEDNQFQPNMLAARLLLLAVFVVAFHLLESLPPPSFEELEEVASIASEEPEATTIGAPDVSTSPTNSRQERSLLGLHAIEITKRSVYDPDYYGGHLVEKRSLLSSLG